LSNKSFDSSVFECIEYLGMVPEYMQEKRPPVITTKGLGSFLKELGFDLASKVGYVGLFRGGGGEGGIL
jgi:hypothetical protein